MATELMQDSGLQDKSPKKSAASAASDGEPAAETGKTKAPKRAAPIKRKRKTKKTAKASTKAAADDTVDTQDAPSAEAAKSTDAPDPASGEGGKTTTPRRKKATRRRKKKTATTTSVAEEHDTTVESASHSSKAADESTQDNVAQTIITSESSAEPAMSLADTGDVESKTAHAADAAEAKTEGPPKRRRRRSGGRKKAAGRNAAIESEPTGAAAEAAPSERGASDQDGQPVEHIAPDNESTSGRSAPETESLDPDTKPRHGRRRRRRSGKSASSQQAASSAATESKPAAKETEKAGTPASKQAARRFEFDDDDADDNDDDGTPAGTGDRTMVINAASDDECRVAVLHEGKLEELFMERTSAESHVNSIFKGRVTNVEPSIQAVFIDFGQAKNGFLHISDVHPHYFPNGKGRSEDVGKKIPRRDRPPIQKCFRRGQEVVVQVIKEGVGTKGPTLTTYLSIPGRFLVMMPGMSRVGVSRKIEDEEQRRSMREILDQLELPDGMGFILRTAGLGQNKRELQRDLNYLQRLWKRIADRIRKEKAPCEVYRESDLVIRSIRDVFSTDFKNIIVDDPETAQKAGEFLKIAMPRSGDLVELYNGKEPLFHKFGIEEEIERINARHVPLALGGSIVIESTEAMVAIDVNSGRFRTVDDAEESALRINMQAAEEIARQLRLRDLGGLIVCDFIDMRLERNKRAVERCLRNALRKHKERARILRMSAFGLIEITRQRQRPSIRKSMYGECPHCRGSGLIKSPESMALEALRTIQVAAHREGVKRIVLVVAAQVANMVQNQKRRNLCEIEERSGTSIFVRADFSYATDQITCELEDELGRPLPMPASQ